ncbi:flagellin [Sphingomonas sp.]|uniref:flagellin n=1 Tax=Sphingomonas sp. TaxID=28214 RepID=UPI0037503D0D
MTRVATIAMHRTLFDAIGRSQARLAASQVQLATGKKAGDFAALGIDAVPTLSARSLIARQEAHGALSNRLGTTLAIQDSALGGAEDAMMRLRTEMLTVIGTGRAAALQGAIEEAFQHFRVAMNAEEGGQPLFAGSATDKPPFKPAALADTIGVPASGAFTNDAVKASARVADGLDVQYGIAASEVGGTLYEAFRTIAETGPIGEVPTAAQSAAFNVAIGQINDGLTTLRSANAENGRRQAQVETLAVRADEKSLLLHQLISRNEDADMAQVASDLTQRETILQASYATYAKLSQLSLLNFLR